MLLKEVSNISCTRNGIVYKPAFVVLSYTKTAMGKVIRTATNQKYTHASMTFDTTMNNMLSFNFAAVGNDERKSGFSPAESFSFGGYTNEGAIYGIYMYLATEEEYKTMKNFVSEFFNNKGRYKFSVRGLIDYYFNKDENREGEYFCSEFVATVLKNANPNLFKVSPHLISPNDLANTGRLKKNR